MKDIIEKAKKGDKGAFSELYRMYFVPLYKYIYFRTGSKIETDDLVQDAFLKIYTSFGRYSHSSDSPLPYFYTIARNAVIDHHRKKKIPIASEEELLSLPDDRNTPEEEAMRKEDASTLRKKIRDLPDDQQDAIILRFINGYSTREIARELGKSEESIRQLQSRGLRTLRKNIDKYNE